MIDQDSSARDEPGRLAALDAYDILDTPPEPGFDDIVLLAAHVCRTPVALISLVAADRQWFKARVGFAPCQTPLDQSVCRHALDRPGLLIIPDLTSDPRTRDNALVKGPPHLRFYAGARLETPDGIAIGTLCVIDAVPRLQGLSPPQAQALEALARQVMAQLTLRQTAAAHDAAVLAARNAAARHRQILASAVDYAIIATDLDGRILSWNAGAENILGWTEAEMIGRSAKTFFTARDNEASVIGDEMQEARDLGRGNDERWHRRKDGSLFWARGEMMPLTAEDGRHVGYLKILRDRTEQLQAATVLQRQSDLLRTVTDHVSEAVFQLDTDGVVSFANPMAGTMLGWPVAELIGRNLHEIAHHHYPDGREFPIGECELVQALPLGRALRKRATTFFRRDGTAIDVLCSNSPVVEHNAIKGAVLTVVDVSELTATAEKLRRSDERLSLALQASGAIGWWDWDLRHAGPASGAAPAPPPTVDGAPVGAAIERFVEGIHPEDRGWVSAAIAAAITTAGAFTAEYRLPRLSGSLRWVYARGHCALDESGRAQRFAGVSVEITERRQSEEQRAALVALGDLLRELTDTADMVYRAAEIAGKTLELDGAAYGAVEDGLFITIQREWSASGADRLSGRHHIAELGDVLAELRRGETVLIDDVARDPRTRAAPLPLPGIRALVAIPLLEHGRLVAVFLLLAARARTWEADRLDFLRTVADRTRAALARQRAEDEQALLNNELSHRMKNLLAMVQAIVTQTLRSATTLEMAKDVLAGRLIALSHAHDLLMGAAIGNTLIQPIVEGVLSVHAEKPERLRISGPEIEIGAKPALALALMLHELATNALKYGALSNADGHVEIAWNLDGPAAEPLLRFAWTEVGGPPVAAPSRKGFGSRFIERGLAGQVGGVIELDYAPTGVVCVVTGGLAAFQSNR